MFNEIFIYTGGGSPEDMPHDGGHTGPDVPKNITTQEDVMSATAKTAAYYAEEAAAYLAFVAREEADKARKEAEQIADAIAFNAWIAAGNK
jgi:hypothetical protein